jgi:putative Ca2+/H+ antiporter (TMEM165/GDT1 family)
VTSTPTAPCPAMPGFGSTRSGDGRRREQEERMNLEKVVFGFFVVLAATLNFGFFIGDIDDPTLHNPYELFAAVVVNLIATVLKFGDRTQIGAVHLATSLVAVLQLIGATLAFGYAEYVSSAGMNAAWTASVVSLSGGALLANVVSVVLLVVETVSFHRG